MWVLTYPVYVLLYFYNLLIYINYFSKLSCENLYLDSCVKTNNAHRVRIIEGDSGAGCILKSTAPGSRDNSCCRVSPYP